jgi:PAS domain S-box-containing protein
MKEILSKNNPKSFFLKVILPAMLAIGLFILSYFVIIIPAFKDDIMDRKREMIRELTNSAWSILSKYEHEERDSIISREVAQQNAISEIKHLRYGEEMKDYFWITDLFPKMIIHPYRPDLNGKDLSEFKDPHGKKLFVEFVNTVKQSEFGYVDYMWQWKDDSLHIVPKLSYVKIFKPWGWVIGTGIYIEDVKKEINALTKKLLWISIGISFLIALILLFISQQSLKIERKRIEVENELNESKEKYKTLVEATTEGLIMLINGKISFSNNVITKMTGYENTELNNVSINEIISENNNPEVISAFSKKIVREGHYNLNLKKKSGGFVEVLLTTSTPVFAKEIVNIITVKDITLDKSSNLSIIDYQRLISILNIGFFRASIDSKGKFIFANDTTIRILGYDSFRELSGTNILEILASSEDRKMLRNNLLDNGFIKNKVIKINKKNNESSIVTITLVAFRSENSKELICDGIIEDVTLQELEKSETNRLIAELKSNSFLIEQSVKDYLTPISKCDSYSTLSEAIKILSTRKTDNLLITANGNDCIGIITNNDIQNRIISLNLNLDNPVYLIMSSPIVYVSENTSIIDAVNICDKKNINHLVVRNEADECTGIFKVNNIYKLIKNSLSFYVSNVEKSETFDEIRQCYKTLLLQIKPLIDSEISVKYITNITSSFSDSAIRKIIELTINEIGEPPVDFSFICLGSEGRREETLFTDQDNAIIYDDVPPEKEKLVIEYFNKLGENVCNALNDIGYSFCKGNIMAKNPQWCKPITVWEKYFAGWITTPEPQNLLDATIFFDFRNIYGNPDFTDRLRKTLSRLINESPLFLYHLAYNTYNTKLQHISSGNIITDKNNEAVDLKSVVNLIIMFARTYSLQNNVWCTNTFERLKTLRTKHIISENTVDEIVFAYSFLMKLRFRNQSELMGNKLPLTNAINTKELIEIELFILKKIMAFLLTCQNKISVDFRITT